MRHEGAGERQAQRQLGEEKFTPISIALYVLYNYLLFATSSKAALEAYAMSDELLLVVFTPYWTNWEPPGPAASKMLFSFE